MQRYVRGCELSIATYRILIVCVCDKWFVLQVFVGWENELLIETENFGFKM
jgi:hypothetical protein